MVALISMDMTVVAGSAADLRPGRGGWEVWGGLPTEN